MNTTENNKLIADFMGGLWSEHSQKYGIGNAQYIDIGTFKNVVKAKNHYSLNELLYHSDWNWLMQVVEKINHQNNVVQIHENHVMVVNNTKGEILVDVVSGSMLEATYDAVVEYIKLKK